MELMRAACNLPFVQPEVVLDFPGHHTWDRLTDDFECFLDDQFNACSTQPTALPMSGPSTCAAAPLEEEAKSDRPGLARPRPMSREQRRKVHNRVAQKQWREKQKVRSKACLRLSFSSGGLGQQGGKDSI